MPRRTVVNGARGGASAGQVSGAAAGRRVRAGCSRRWPRRAGSPRRPGPDSQTSPMILAIAISSADGSPSCMALVSMCSISRATVLTSAAALGSANMNARVIASVSIGSRCMVAGDPAQHEQHPLVRRVTGDRYPVQLLLVPLELPGQPGHQQVNLGGEIPVERAKGHARPVGHRPHLHRVVAAAGRQRQGGVQDPLTALALGRRAELGLGGRARGGGGTCSRCCHSGPLSSWQKGAVPPAPRRCSRTGAVTRSSSRPAYQ